MIFISTSKNTNLYNNSCSKPLQQNKQQNMQDIPKLSCILCNPLATHPAVQLSACSGLAQLSPRAVTSSPRLAASGRRPRAEAGRCHLGTFRVVSSKMVVWYRIGRPVDRSVKGVRSLHVNLKPSADWMGAQ